MERERRHVLIPFRAADTQRSNRARSGNALDLFPAEQASSVCRTPSLPESEPLKAFPPEHTPSELSSEEPSELSSEDRPAAKKPSLLTAVLVAINRLIAVALILAAIYLALH